MKSHLSQRQKWLIATAIGAGFVIYRACSSLKSPYSSTSSALPRLSPNLPEYKDIPYKQIGEKVLHLDIYKPLTARNTNRPVPAIIFIHGGSWVKASKNNIRKTFRQYALHKLIRNGFAVISIDYRLADSSRLHIPEQIADCKDAIRWIHVHGTEYGIDCDNLGVWGSSAGGHLAMMSVYTDDEMYPGDPSLKDIQPCVNYLIDTFGPTDLNSLFRTGLNPALLAVAKMWVKKIIAKRDGQIRCVTGFDISKEKERVRQLCREYSPINYVSANSCPTLIMHGTADRTVKISQSIRLLQRLKRFKVESSLIRFKNLRHSFCNASPQQAKEVAQHILNFARSHYQMPK